ncbi:MAG TPA: hypothetical protein VN851_15460 [Thermoanaerobaculia bacterium]|nr:hypothetical protein [Thermoanaerobaculia bacterium]
MTIPLSRRWLYAIAALSFALIGAHPVLAVRPVGNLIPFPENCGDFVCSFDEDCSNCPDDCGPCFPTECGDFFCNPSVGESCSTCPTDCSCDADGDGVGDSGDNCPGTYNPDQADCDHDGVGDACDGYNGTTTFLGYDLYLLYAYPVFDFCSGSWLYEEWLGLFFERDYYQFTPCSGSPTTSSNDYYFYGYFLTVTYDPYTCGWFATEPGSGSSKQDQPASGSGRHVVSSKDFQLKVENGKLFLVTPQGEREMPTKASWKGLRQQGDKVLLDGPQGEHELRLQLVVPSDKDLMKLPPTKH